MRMTRYVAKIILSQPELAVAELETVLNVDVSSRSGRWTWFDSDEQDKSMNDLASRLAMTTDIYEILETSDSDLYPPVAAKHINNSYRLEVKSTHDDSPELLSIADIIFNSLDNPVVDIHDPDNEYLILFSNKIVFICKHILSLEQKFFDRRSHRLVHNHPTSINPRYARAMVNLSDSHSLLDPFCGAGGILLEAALLNLQITGGDISGEMILRARDNLESFSLDIPLHVRDARDWVAPVGAIVTDLPYGRNSFASEKIDTLYKSFFQKAALLTDRIVAGCLSDHPIEAVLDSDTWSIQESFDIYIHKSMTRRILVIEKKK
ncbi:MAG: hypothetical protein ACQESE_05275 [Nanobdellota archaeon]